MEYADKQIETDEKKYDKNGRVDDSHRIKTSTIVYSYYTIIHILIEEK